MKKALILSLILSSVVLFFNSCQEDGGTVSFPKVNTLPVTDVTPDGAIFHAQIISTSEEPITSYGFSWTDQKDDLFTIQSEFIEFIGTPESVLFQRQISTTLEEAVTYYVRSFVKAGEYTVYGDIVEFVSLGSGAPTIFSLQPNHGMIRDTIMIIGENFSNNPQTNVVNFGEFQAYTTFRSDTLIKAIVPDQVISSSKIHVSILGNKASSEEDFVFDRRVITEVHVGTALSYDTISVTTNHFLADYTFYSFFINDITVEPINTSNTGFSVVVPPGISNPVTISSKRPYDEIYNKENAFQYLKPEVTRIFPSTGTIGDIVTITGKNFQARNNLDTIDIAYNHKNLELLSVSSTEIKFTVPESFNVADFQVSLKSSGHTITNSNLRFQLDGPEITTVSPTEVQLGDVIVIQGNHFRPQADENTIYFNGIQGDILEANTTQIKSRIGNNVGFDKQGKIDIELYAYSQRASIQDAIQLKEYPVLLDYSPETVNSLDQVITIEGSNLDLAVANLVVEYGGIECRIVSVNENSIEFTLPATLLDEYRDYNPKELSQNISLKFNSPYHTFENQLKLVSRKYPLTRLNDFQGAFRSAPFYFSIDGIGYMGGGKYDSESMSDFWTYDPEMDMWSKQVNFPGGKNHESEAITYNNAGYVLLGKNGSTDLKEFWMYDPSSQLWTELEDYPGKSASQFALFIDGDNLHVSLGRDTDLQYNHGLDEHFSYSFSDQEWNQKDTIRLGSYFEHNFRYKLYNGPSTTFVFDGTPYILLWTRSQQSLNGSWYEFVNDHFFSYNNTTDSWSYQAGLFDSVRDLDYPYGSMAVNTIQHKDEVYFQSDWNITTFNSTSNSLVQKTRLPSLSRNPGFYFSIGDKIYIGLVQGELYESFVNSVWEYDPTIDHL